MDRTERFTVGIRAVAVAGGSVLAAGAAWASGYGATSGESSDPDPGLLAVSGICSALSLAMAAIAFVLGVETLVKKGNLLLGLVGVIIPVAVVMAIVSGVFWKY